MPEREMNLRDLFGDNHMKMQSSTVYRALRGEGMRVTPLVTAKVSAESHKVVNLSHTAVTDIKPKTPKEPEKSQVDGSTTKTTHVGNIVDLRADSRKDGLLKRPHLKSHLHQAEQDAETPPKPPTATKVAMEFKNRDIATPVSATGTQRVPFTSTKLDKHVSRESLKEEESDLKPKLHKKSATGKKNMSVSKDPIKSRFAIPRPKSPQSAPQRLTLYKHKKIKNAGNEISQLAQLKAVPAESTSAQNRQQASSKNERLRTASRLVPGSAHELPRSAQKLPSGSAKNPTPSSAQRLKIGNTRKPPSSSHKTPGKNPSLGLELWGDFPSNVGSRRSVAVSDEAATKKKKGVGPSRKKLWIPTSEAVESWNQFCPSSKVKMRRKRAMAKRRPIQFEEEKLASSRSGRSDIDDESDDESSELDEVERMRLAKEAIRRQIEQKSVELFNQFKYGETLKKTIPRIRYNSESRPETSSADRLSEVEVKMRLSRLNESASRINEKMPKWSSMLMTTIETNREEQIRKTLSHAQHILDRKVDKATDMLYKYINSSGPAMSSEEMEDIRRHSELVQLDMNSLERMFAAHEKQLADELDEPSSIAP